jgi:hypothetical protein
MEEATAEGLGPEVPVAPVGWPSPEAPVIEGSSATDMDDADLICDHTRFSK